MEKCRLLVKYQPNYNKYTILLEFAYSMNEYREEMDATSPDEEFPVVQPSVWQPDILETNLENVVYPLTILTP